MPKLRFIFFDATGTLIKVRNSVGHIYAEVGFRHGIQLEEFWINQEFKRIFSQAPPLCFPNHQEISLQDAEYQWWKERSRAILKKDQFASPEKFEAFFSDLYQTFSKQEAWEVFPEVPSTLSGLRKKGLRLGVISNFDSRLHGILEGLKLRHFFEQVTCSTELGYAKPDLEIFTASFPKKLKPNEMAYVGHDWEKDILPARILGLRVWQLVRGPSIAEPKEDTIQRLSDLLNIVI